MTVAGDSFQLMIKLNREMAEAFKEAMEGKEDIPESIKMCSKVGNLATVDDITWLHSNKKSTPAFHELISGCELQLPKPIETPRNPELEARIQRLKADQEEREYRRMIKNVESSKRARMPEESIGFQLKQINRQLIAILQFVFSVAAGFMFGFLGVEFMTGELDFGFRLLLGVICSLIIALAEIYFLAKKLAEDDEPYVPPQPIRKLHQD